jgi:uncharacterized integral membrane protein
MADDDRRWDAGQSQVDREGFRPSAKQIGAGAIVVALIVFVLQNTDSTPVTLLVFDVTFPLWLMLAATIVLSLGVGYVLGSRGKTRKKKD